ncbi:MAG: hypothetical protein HRU20_19825 [Pseudomonadales bacterium]|nr:hypothetical protein [Pseudomonadales bacterium]
MLPKRDSHYVHLFSGEVSGGEVSGSGSLSGSVAASVAVQGDADRQNRDDCI